MRALLDVNVLVALLDRQSAARPVALDWLASNRLEGWASCPLTENGCLRIMTNPRYPAPLLPGEVLDGIESIKNSPHHEFWPDDLSITDAARFDRSQLRGHQQVTDVYLLALAVAHGGRLVTFDQGVRRDAVPASRSEHLVLL